MCRGTTYLRRRKATSQPRNVRRTAPLLTAGRHAPPRCSVCCSGVLFPRPVLRGSHLPALSWSRLSRYFSPSWHLDCPHCSRISPACQEFCPGSRLSYGKRRKIDKTAAPRTTVRPFFLSTRLSPPPIVLPPRTRFSLPRLFPAPPLDSAPRRPSKPPPVEPPTVEPPALFSPERQNTRRESAGCVFDFDSLTETRLIIQPFRWFWVLGRGNLQ